MAIFEKTSQAKTIIDDTEKLICTVENTQNINKYTEYILRVERGVTKEKKWNVSRRYRDFAALHSILQQSNIELPLPPKKLIGNMHPSFVAERQIGLQVYINEVLKHPILALSSHVRSFLDPSNYPSNLAEQALQTVSIALRGDGKYELKGPLPNIGWRIRKHYFLVTDTKTRANCLLSWQSYGPDKHLSDKDMQIAFKCLQSLSHPCIDQILASHCLESGAYVVREIHENGSLRDILYGTEYNKNFLTKYGNPKIRKPLTNGQISHYGRQLLETLKFLNDKGVPHGHIHAGNIAIENQQIRLLDLENNIVGVSAYCRPYIVELKKSSSAEAVDVYSFGRTLYEMAFAESLSGVSLEVVPVGLPGDLEDILRLCLSPSSCKHGMPSLEELLRHPFIRPPLVRGNGVLDVRAHLKLPSTLKGELGRGVAAVEDRLKTDQKLLRTARRELRIQEILGSEEEMRKQKRRAKKRDSIWKSSSSLAETVRSHSASTGSSPTPPAHRCPPSPPAHRCPPTPPTLPPEPPSLNGNCSSLAPSTSPGNDGRSALLTAICGFDKSRLSRINSR